MLKIIDDLKFFLRSISLKDIKHRALSYRGMWDAEEPSVYYSTYEALKALIKQYSKSLS